MADFPERDPDNYVWQFFYYNKKDTRFFLPKANPDYGVTINFAHRAAVVGFLAMLAFFAFVMIVIDKK